jgi:hypothetical protein
MNLHDTIEAALQRHGAMENEAGLMVTPCSLAMDIESELLAATGGPDHIVQVKGSEWVIQHPLDERFESGAASGLFNCEITQLVGAAYRVDGTFRVWLDRQALLWEEVTP